jgi:hypothetical protein
MSAQDEVQHGITLLSPMCNGLLCHEDNAEHSELNLNRGVGPEYRRQ